MKIGAIVFSRMSSNRLQGKAMMDISGKTLLQRVIERTKKIKLIDHFCIATSKNQEDDIISAYAESMGLDVYRGSLDDVAKELLKLQKNIVMIFFRICAIDLFLIQSFMTI